MPGPEGRTPHHYDVDRGVKTESYITAVSRNPVPPIHPPAKGVTYNKVISLGICSLIFFCLYCNAPLNAKCLVNPKKALKSPGFFFLTDILLRHRSGSSNIAKFGS
ncbi:hypothetical protein Y032_0047g1480 [Ancylostoma ceylanicum]|nr:hypothetical protein Y032_0047g1480 [Ancylostoma ceylanicum]